MRLLSFVQLIAYRFAGFFLFFFVFFFENRHNFTKGDWLSFVVKVDFCLLFEINLRWFQHYLSIFMHDIMNIVLSIHHLIYSRLSHIFFKIWWYMYYFNSLEIFDYNSQYYKQYSYNFKLTNVNFLSDFFKRKKWEKNAILLYNQKNNISCYMGQMDL